jgi:acyl-CoA reductase-like NAD-dependent aldehyde dehydrogenase
MPLPTFDVQVNTDSFPHRWSGTLLLYIRAVPSAPAAGCTAILKTSEPCPQTHQFVAKTFLQAGFPAGSVKMVVTSRAAAAEVTEAIISRPKQKEGRVYW